MNRLWQQLRFARDHRWAPGHMSAYLESDLRGRARARLERHLAQCADCTGVLDSLRYLLGRLHQAAPADPHAPDPQARAPEITAAVLRRLHE